MKPWTASFEPDRILDLSCEKRYELGRLEKEWAKLILRTFLFWSCPKNSAWTEIIHRHSKIFMPHSNGGLDFELRPEIFRDGL